MVAAVKQRVRDAPYDEAYPREMVERAYRDNVGLGDAAEPENLDHLVRRIYRWRNKGQASNPTDLDFELDVTHFPPGFFRKVHWKSAYDL